MKIRGYCTACGSPGEVSSQFLCELCAGVGRTVVVCRKCEVRNETDRPTLRQMIAETDEDLIPDDDSCGVTIAIDRCGRCKKNGDTEENIMTFYVIGNPTVQ